MTGVGFFILFGLNCLFLPCKGVITSPPNGTQYVFLPGETAKIKWDFNDPISSLHYRFWYLRNSDFPLSLISLASIHRNDEDIITYTASLEIDIERPSTLVLTNVNQKYNGVYQFELNNQANRTFRSEVTVYITKKPTVALNCCSAILEIGRDFICECKGLDGNPSVNVTWYKDGNEMQGNKGTKEQLLTLTKVNEADSGTYKCVAESYPDPKYRDEKSITINVRWRGPITQKPLIRNTSEKSIPNGSGDGSDSCGTVVVWHIVVTLLSGIIIGILFSHIVSCSRRRWFRNRKPERNSEPQMDGVDTTYQELDLTKMNTEDNYQSLRGNVAVRASNDVENDEESTYTQLSKIRDVEDNYQSLT